MLTHRNLIADSFHLSTALRLAPEDRWLVVGPIFHAAGSLAAAADHLAGRDHVVLPSFDPAAALDRIERHRVTIASAGADHGRGDGRRAARAARGTSRRCA